MSKRAEEPRVDRSGEPTCWYCRGEACYPCESAGTLGQVRCDHDLIDRHGDDACADLPESSCIPIGPRSDA